MILWSVVAVFIGVSFLARDYRKQAGVVSWHSFRWWLGQVAEVVAASVLAFGWLWLLVMWLSR